MGRQLLGGEIARQILKRALILGKFEIHGLHDKRRKAKGTGMISAENGRSRRGGPKGQGLWVRSFFATLGLGLGVRSFFATFWAVMAAR